MSVARPGRRYAGLSLADWGVMAATVLLTVSLQLPWVSFAGVAVQPAKLAGIWVLAVPFLMIVLPTVLAGRWPYTRWMGLDPLVFGFLLLGVVGGIAATVLVLNPLLAGIPYQEINDVVQTVTRLADVIRLQNDQLDRITRAVNRFALEPQISFQEGVWLFGVSTLALIIIGYQKVVETFSREVPVAAPLPLVAESQSAATD